LLAVVVNRPHLLLLLLLLRDATADSAVRMASGGGSKRLQSANSPQLFRIVAYVSSGTSVTKL